MTFITYGDERPDDAEPDDTLWGSDESGLVKVGLSPDEHVRGIVIADSWKAQVGPEMLGPALMAAYAAAISLRVHSHPHGAPLTEPGGPANDNLSTDAGVVDYALFERADQERADYLATYGESLADQRIFTSSDGNVTVTARGGAPISIHLDEAWLGFAQARHIGESTTEAFGPAVESGLAIAAEMRERFPAVSEFLRLHRLKTATRGW